MSSHKAAHSLAVQSVMVVDDSMSMRRHIVGLCRSMGIALIYEACNGQEALAQLDMLKLAPDVLITDLHMPVMDGVELIGQLHQRGLRIPVAIISSHPQDVLDATEAMCHELQMPLLCTLRKPVLPDDLCSALQRFEDRQTTLLQPPLPPVGLGVNAQSLCAAIDQRQIDVHYQPKVDVRTGLVRGMEVLARWHHPEHGFIPPTFFIALAEKEQLIHELTMLVLRKSCAQAALWKRHGFAPCLAVNLSNHVLSCPSIVGEIMGVVQGCGISPSQLVLEITESAGVEHFGQAIALLTRLRLQGFGLSIDDYGTGFSSMQQLARLPFTELKIDRSFVHKAHQRQSVRVILESALEMTKRLGLISVAEGVETLDDWRLLQQYGCQVGQGFLIAKPMPASAVAPWLREHRLRLQELRQPVIPA